MKTFRDLGIYLNGMNIDILPPKISWRFWILIAMPCKWQHPKDEYLTE